MTETGTVDRPVPSPNLPLDRDSRGAGDRQRVGKLALHLDCRPDLHRQARSGRRDPAARRAASSSNR